MKPILVCLVLLLVIHTNCFAQQPKPPAPTTGEEYNYITKGYQTQVTEGLDMKKGYHFKDMGAIKNGNYNFTFKLLIRESTNEMAGVLVIAQSLVWKKVYYLCIPHGNQDLANRYWSQLNLWDRSMSVAYDQVTSLMLGALVAKDYGIEK
jgi:hypothetical protein